MAGEGYDCYEEMYVSRSYGEASGRRSKMIELRYFQEPRAWMVKNQEQEQFEAQVINMGVLEG